MAGHDQLVSGLTHRNATAAIQFSGSPVPTGWTTHLPIMTGAAAIIALLALLTLARFRQRRAPHTRHAHA